MSSELSVLAKKYGTDKDHSIRHSYIDFYNSTLKKDSVKRVLEIGIGTHKNMSFLSPNYTTGASLLMWRDYFNDAQIYGIDIEEDSMISAERINTLLVDQKDPRQLFELIEKIGGNFDLIVDDGSHDKDHQLISFHVLHNYLAKGGYYIIEDVTEPDVIKRSLYYASFSVYDFDKNIFDDRLMVYKND